MIILRRPFLQTTSGRLFLGLALYIHEKRETKTYYVIFAVVTLLLHHLLVKI